MSFGVYKANAKNFQRSEFDAWFRLRFVNGILQLHKNPVVTVSLSEAVLGFFEFLCSFERKCILTAYNYIFDYHRIMNAIDKVFMKKRFQSIIQRFCDTIPIIKKCTGKKVKSEKNWKR